MSDRPAPDSVSADSTLRALRYEILRATGDNHHHDGIESEEDLCPTCSDVLALLRKARTP